jgi:folate-binding protein YgfZ
MFISPLPHRGILEIQGEDKATFLQGLISNDINLITPEHALYATLLSPQGRFLYDFFIMEKEGSFFLDGEAARLADLAKKLNLYKLRSHVTLTLRPDLKVFALWGEEEMPKDTFMDPRLTELGARFIGEHSLPDIPIASPEDYNLHRLKLGVPEGGTDLIPEKSILLECGLEELNAISWNKGCYVGQELTARTKFQGLVRKRLFPVRIEGTAPDFGTEIFLGDIAVGSMRSHRKGFGLALLRLEYVKELPELRCDEAILKPYKPFWMVL